MTELSPSIKNIQLKNLTASFGTEIFHPHYQPQFHFLANQSENSCPAYSSVCYFNTISAIYHSISTIRESSTALWALSFCDEDNISANPGTRTNFTVELVDVKLLGRNRMYSAVRYDVGRELAASGKEAELAIRRRRALKRVDKELSSGNFKTALSLVKKLRSYPAGGIRGFGSAKQVPKRLTSLNELELDAKELLPLQSLLGSVMNSIERCNLFYSFDEAGSDRVEHLTVDEGYGSLIEEDHFMCMQHEAGHFLVGYLLGVLPKGYNVPSVEALRKDKFAVGSVQFIGFEFLKEIAFASSLRKDIGRVGGRTDRGKISSKTLNNFSCVILGGLVAEHIIFGSSEGHYADINKMEKLLRWLGFKKNEVESQVRWAALNTVLLSHRHIQVQSRLSEAMAQGRSVGFCIDTIENALLGKKI